jgi:hypothetical protein
MFQHITHKARDGSDDMEVVGGLPCIVDKDKVWEGKGRANDGGLGYEVIDHPEAAPVAYTTHSGQSVLRQNYFRIWDTPSAPQHNVQLAFIQF